MNFELYVSDSARKPSRAPHANVEIHNGEQTKLIKRYWGNCGRTWRNVRLYDEIGLHRRLMYIIIWPMGRANNMLEERTETCHEIRRARYAASCWIEVTSWV